MKTSIFFRLFLLAIILVYTAACKKNKDQAAREHKVTQNLNALFKMMTGSFNSAAQAESDSAYYNISLHMYPIWKDRGNWLYVEQALNTMQNKPYRQRIYYVTSVNDSVYKSQIYTLPNDSLWIGKWKTPEAFGTLHPDSLQLRSGCAVYLKKTGSDMYSGATKDRDCPSELRGASYATSEVTITPNKIVSWDRGFDTNGKQVWGAEKEGYIFERIQPSQN
ncbi:chromophore lyase CpcT/CpeT [Ascidiimonas aurantiaca]|uniref:chromophore lyase CpcT/CpeT n=1 Tax=Ascidiimonas aurantiaca TaxID=1685432 RepID=UPI0030EF7BC9